VIEGSRVGRAGGERLVVVNTVFFDGGITERAGSRARVGVGGAAEMFLALRGYALDYENSKDSRAEDHPTFRRR
jgi:hypothetical protein